MSHNSRKTTDRLEEICATRGKKCITKQAKAIMREGTELKLLKPYINDLEALKYILAQCNPSIEESIEYFSEQKIESIWKSKYGTGKGADIEVILYPELLLQVETKFGDYSWKDLGKDCMDYFFPHNNLFVTEATRDYFKKAVYIDKLIPEDEWLEYDREIKNKAIDCFNNYLAYKELPHSDVFVDICLNSSGTPFTSICKNYMRLVFDIKDDTVRFGHLENIPTETYTIMPIQKLSSSKQLITIELSGKLTKKIVLQESYTSKIEINGMTVNPNKRIIQPTFKVTISEKKPIFYDMPNINKFC